MSVSVGIASVPNEVAILIDSILITSALPKDIIPLSISDCEVTCNVSSLFNVLIFDPATDLSIVAKIFILCPAKLAPKSNVKVFPEGEPASTNIGSPSWLFPVILKISPDVPVVPAPVVIIETAKSLCNNALNVSLVPAVIVASPFDDNVWVNCLLTLKLVSVIPELPVVFNVFIVS